MPRCNVARNSVAARLSVWKRFGLPWLVLPLVCPQFSQAGMTGDPTATLIPVLGMPEAQARPGVTSYPASYFDSAQPSSAKDMIDRLPGFTFDAGSDTRGFVDSVGNVLIDGTSPASKTDGIENQLQRIPAAQVERIDVIRGGASGIDMKGKSVVANVIRKTTPASTELFGVSAGHRWSGGPLLGGIRIEGTHTGTTASFEGSLAAHVDFDEGSGAGPETVTTPNGSLVSMTHDTVSGKVIPITATGAYTDLLWGGRLRANAQITIQSHPSDEIDAGSATSPSQSAIESEHESLKLGEIGVTYDGVFGPKLSTQLLFLGKRQQSDDLDLYSAIDEQDTFLERNRVSEGILRSSIRYTWSDSLSLQGGNEVDLNRLSSRTTYLVNGAPISLPAADTQVVETRVEPYAQAVWSAVPALAIDGSMRIEYSHLTSSGGPGVNSRFLFSKPRIMLTWNPDSADQVRVRLERQIDQLEFQNFIASSELTTGQVYAGNPNLVPQQAWVFEAANQWSFWKSGDLTLTLRHFDIQNVLDRGTLGSTSGGFDAPANIGRGTKSELASSITLPLDGFGMRRGLLKGQITWRRSSVADPTTNRQRPISGVRPREGTLEFTDDLTRWHMSWGASYNLGWTQRLYRFYDTESYALRHSARLFVEQKPHRKLSIRAEVSSIGFASSRNLHVFADSQYPGTPTYVDDRELGFGPTLYLRANYSM